jgi:hypothetical protein
LEHFSDGIIAACGGYAERLIPSESGRKSQTASMSAAKRPFFAHPDRWEVLAR